MIRRKVIILVKTTTYSIYQSISREQQLVILEDELYFFIQTKQKNNLSLKPSFSQLTLILNNRDVARSYSGFFDPNSFIQQQYVPNHCRTAMYSSDLGLTWDPFYKVEVVRWCVMKWASSVRVIGWDCACGVILTFLCVIVYWVKSHMRHNIIGHDTCKVAWMATYVTYSHQFSTAFLLG